MADRVLYQVEDRVATVTMSLPDKLNAMDRQTFEELRRAAARAAEDPDVGAVVVTGAGRAFSSGLDLAEFAGMAEVDHADTVIGELQRAIGAFELLPKPVVAAVNGLAVGGGLQLAIACDLRLAAASAQFASWEMRWAIVPDLGGTERLPRLIGLGNRVVPDADLALAAAELAAGLASGPTLALGMAKQLLNEAFDRGVSEGLSAARRAQRLTLASADHREARAAFAERRPPRFSGR